MAIKQKKKIVQGAWISIEDHELLQAEARRLGLRSSTAMASQILTGHCDKRRMEDAKDLIRQDKKGVRQHGEGQKRKGRVRGGGQKAANE